MIFRTPIQVEKQPRQINYRDPILMLGSCFTENIGSHLSNLLFDAVVNPFGVVYNPLSVQKNIFQLLNKERYMEDDLNLHGELWFSFDHYTLYSDPDPKKALEKINADFVRARETLSSARFLIITFGTAYTYRYRKSGEIVCNCHKIPANEFERSLLSPKTIIREYKSLLTELGK